jgi:hypothetical protein
MLTAGVVEVGDHPRVRAAHYQHDGAAERGEGPPARPRGAQPRPELHRTPAGPPPGDCPQAVHERPDTGHAAAWFNHRTADRTQPLRHRRDVRADVDDPGDGSCRPAAGGHRRRRVRDDHLRTALIGAQADAMASVPCWIWSNAPEGRLGCGAQRPQMKGQLALRARPPRRPVIHLFSGCRFAAIAEYRRHLARGAHPAALTTSTDG